MTREERKEYNKLYYQAHKKEHNKKMKAWQEEHREAYKTYQKAYQKVWHKEHKEEIKTKNKVWREDNREEFNNRSKKYYQKHREEVLAYRKFDINSLGQSKNYIREKSRRYLVKYGQKIKGYEIHHCFGYSEPYKFIYCSKSLHLKIHQFLRDNNIDADSDHYEQIKHLLDKTVVVYGVN